MICPKCNGNEISAIFTAKGKIVVTKVSPTEIKTKVDPEDVNFGNFKCENCGYEAKPAEFKENLSPIASGTIIAKLSR